ncbi:MAG: DUF1080 domain-containing protein [Verrucomicrobia bacterium]|nr:DUF1080 domain-containing protein [Verrucomicrobiota bacterium]
MRFLFVLTLLSALSQAAPFSLFDGKTLQGWDFDPAMWRVEDGMITGGSTTEKIKKNDFISTKQSYQNFDLKLKIKVSGDPKTGLINSGIQIRSVRDGGAMSGYQVDCGAGWFGKIYDEHRRNKVIWSPTPEQQAALDKAIDVTGWNEYRILAEGPRIQTWINGVYCMDYTETDPNIALDGHIAPQVHSGGIALVQVKDVTIEELPATPGIPTWEKVGHPKPKAAFQNEKGKSLFQGSREWSDPRRWTEKSHDFCRRSGYPDRYVALGKWRYLLHPAWSRFKALQRYRWRWESRHT